MEAPELFQAGFCRSWAAHCGPEKVGWGGEQFVVEDLLDFSNEEEASGCVAAAADEGGEGGSDGADENSTGSSTVTAADSCCNSLSACDLKAVFCRSIADASLPDDFCEPVNRTSFTSLVSPYECVQNRMPTDSLFDWNRIVLI